LTCGLLSPVGLLVSLVGLTRHPRGFAVAGVIVGAVGSIGLLVFGATFLLALLGFTAAHESVAEKQPLWDAAAEIEKYESIQGHLPDSHEGQSAIAKLSDRRGLPLKYEIAGDEFVIRSSGPDGKFGTSDDIEHRAAVKSSSGSGLLDFDD